jgi:hypothetical protein
MYSFVTFPSALGVSDFDDTVLLLATVRYRTSRIFLANILIFCANYHYGTFLQYTMVTDPYS